MEDQHPGAIGVILAAGASRRLGRPKQLLDVHGVPLLQYTVDHARESRLDEVIVVLGANREQIEDAVDFDGVRIVINPRFEEGQSTSVIAALDGMKSEVSGTDIAGVLFLLGDQPGVTRDVIDAVVDVFDGDPQSIVMVEWQGRRAHPVLFGRGYFEELRQLTGDMGARPIIKTAGDRVRTVAIDRPVPQDVDTEEDYQRLLADSFE